MNIGDKMPDMLGKDAEGKDIRLSDFPGKKFIIYFYPKDNTPGCTAEAVSLRDNYETLLKMGYQVIGVSKDSEAEKENGRQGIYGHCPHDIRLRQRRNHHGCCGKSQHQGSSRTAFRAARRKRGSEPSTLRLQDIKLC